MNRKNIYLGLLAEECGRYNDIILYLEIFLKEKVKTIVFKDVKLLTIAYKNMISKYRTALKTLINIEKDENRSSHRIILKEYKFRIKNDLDKLVSHAIEIIDSIQIEEKDLSSKALLLNTKGEFHRYCSEYSKAKRNKSMHLKQWSHIFLQSLFLTV